MAESIVPLRKKIKYSLLLSHGLSFQPDEYHSHDHIPPIAPYNDT